MFHARFGKHIWLLAAAITCYGITNAQENGVVDISLSSTYMRDNLRWSIAGNIQGTDPNIYSELVWKKLQTVSVGGELTWRVWKALLIRAGYTKAFITGGTVTDTDYGADNRTNPVYFGNFKGDKGFNASYNVMAGYRVSVKKDISFTTWLGYSNHTQQLYLLPADANTQSALESSYGTSWHGMVIGTGLQAKITQNLSVSPALTYYQVKYHGTADWNLIQSFRHPVSFEDFANGFGIEPSVRFLYQINRRLSICLNGQYFYWRTGKGTDYLYLSSGSTVTTQFNEAKREGFMAGLGLTIKL
jgi:hypothetical protein